MLQRTAFKRKTTQAAPRPERVTKWPVALDVRAQAAIQTIAPEFKAQPKTIQQRNARLLAMAKGMPCLLLVPACCNHRTDTTVACHQNEGKGMAQKRPDYMTVWGCSACHAWYDQSCSPRSEKRDAFNEAHLRQVLVWENLLLLGALKPADRTAVQWALDRVRAV